MRYTNSLAGVFLACSAALTAPIPVAREADPADGGRFQAVRYEEGNGRFDWRVTYGTFTTHGPVDDSFIPLPSRIEHLTRDTKRDVNYGLANHKVVKYDPKTRKIDAVPIPADLPELSWPCGIAYDSKRDRVVVISLGGEGHMYAYEPAGDKWSLITDMDNIDSMALTYDPGSDLLYALCRSNGAKQVVSLRAFDGKGVVKAMVPIDHAAIQAMPPGIRFKAQLVSVRDKAVIVTPERIVKVDAKTGEAVETWTKK